MIGVGLEAPLSGCTILITADRRHAELGSALRSRGAKIRHAPVLRVIPHLDDTTLVERTKEIIADPPKIVVATTGIGFRGWIEAADAAGLGDDLLATLRNCRIIARGPKARGAIDAAGLTADWVATSETSHEIQDLLLAEGVSGQRVVVQHHGSTTAGLDDAFKTAGADVVSLVVYRWGDADPVAVRDSLADTANGLIDAVVFTSAQGATAWLSEATQDQLDAMRRFERQRRLVLASVGPMTAAPLQEAGLSPLVSGPWRLGAIVRALVAHYTSFEKVATVAGDLSLRTSTALIGGRAIPLTPTGRVLLGALVEARGAVVSTEQLAALLPHDNNDAHSVSVAMSRLRDACGSIHLVKQVMTRGYCLTVSPD